VAGFRKPPPVAPLERLADLADVVVECAPAAVYDAVARPAVERGRILITMSSGALLARPDLIDRAKQTGARIIVPSGGVLGFDGLMGAREGEITDVRLVTRKPPKSFAGAPYLEAQNISVDELTKPLLIFDGNARDAAAAFPANANVAASLCLAGIGPERTMVEMWAVPGLETLSQEIRVQADSCRFTISLESYPLPDNPRTGSLTPKSLIAALRALGVTLRIGT
jgi:aspartate dehydrogenase